MAEYCSDDDEMTNQLNNIVHEIDYQLDTIDFNENYNQPDDGSDTISVSSDHTMTAHSDTLSARSDTMSASSNATTVNSEPLNIVVQAEVHRPNECN
ncbi:unnamed protein product [Arctia plantaginis]|uniref:Uncharacterized protein n=1 Tax=Arctia plantaginis TaxID=874455 RepID=A0A8S0ZSP6_ARCPL|nr:unnamed protein product [Arctia plantaginis]